jgi:hypothetical protein
MHLYLLALSVPLCILIRLLQQRSLHLLIIAGLPVPGELLAFCSIAVWSPPRGPFDDFSGYDVRFYVPEGGEMMMRKSEREFFQQVTEAVRALGPMANILVQVGDFYVAHEVTATASIPKLVRNSAPYPWTR